MQIYKNEKKNNENTYIESDNIQTSHAKVPINIKNV